MIGSDTEEIIKELFQKLPSRYQTGFEQAMNGSNFLFNNVERFFYNS